MKMKCSIICYCLILLLGLTISDTAWSYTDTEIHNLVQNRLLDRHPTDTPQWWQSLGDNSVPVIISMYTDENNTFHRIRLLQGLGWMDNPQAIDFVKEQTEQTDSDVLRNAGIRAIARGQGAKETDFVAKFLKNDDPQTRFAAAESLKEIGSRDSRAHDLYTAYLRDEKTQWLVDKLNGKALVIGSLRPVSSSEDRISPMFEGTWRGFWMLPKTGKGMDANSVLLQLKTSSDSSNYNSVGGTLNFVKNGRFSKSFDLGKGFGKGEQISGNFVEAATAPNSPRQAYSFQGDLTRIGDEVLLEIRVPAKNSVLVLKKD